MPKISLCIIRGDNRTKINKIEERRPFTRCRQIQYTHTARLAWLSSWLFERCSAKTDRKIFVYIKIIHIWEKLHQHQLEGICVHQDHSYLRGATPKRTGRYMWTSRSFIFERSYAKTNWKAFVTRVYLALHCYKYNYVKHH